MSGKTDEQALFGLMAITEDLQKEARAELEKVAKEREALARVLEDAAEALARVGPELQAAAAEAGRVASNKVAATAAEALSVACAPVVAGLGGVARAAHEAEYKLNGAVRAFGWKWAMLAGGAAAGGIAAVLVAAWALVWWQRSQVEGLSKQKAALIRDVDQLKAGVEALEKRGGRIVITDCGGRLCIEASTNQGPGFERWKGAAWSVNGVLYIVPRGY